MICSAVNGEYLCGTPRLEDPYHRLVSLFGAAVSGHPKSLGWSATTKEAADQVSVIERG